MPKSVSVAGVARQGDRILVMHRLPGGSVGSLWEFPGGKVDSGETTVQALRREWKEETGFNIEVGGEIARGQFTHKGQPITLIAFEVRLPADAGEPKLIEHDDWKWATVGEIAGLPLVESDLTVLEALRAGDQAPG